MTPETVTGREAADIIDDYRAALMAALPLDTPEQTVEKLRRGLKVVLEAVRREAFQPSPLTEWLMGEPGTRFTMAEYDDETKRVRCNLDDINDDGDDPVAVGYGETIEAAQSDALNKLMGKRQ